MYHSGLGETEQRFAIAGRVPLTVRIRTLVALVALVSEHHALAQFARFMIAGLGVTALSAMIYLAAAMLAHVPPLVANLISYLIGVGIGYTVHSRWSFRAEGAAAGAVTRFLVVNGIGLALNSLWVWLATGVFHLPAWAPVPAMAIVTPLVSFALNRNWVFRQSRHAA